MVEKCGIISENSLVSIQLAICLDFEMTFRHFKWLNTKILLGYYTLSWWNIFSFQDAVKQLACN